jgi:hypothetical protein
MCNNLFFANRCAIILISIRIWALKFWLLGLLCFELLDFMEYFWKYLDCNLCTLMVVLLSLNVMSPRLS